MSDRTVIAVTGSDRIDFLQGLITNDVLKADGGLVYAALLTPQGKLIADFFVAGQNDRLLLDVDSELAPTLAQRLTMYRLRADVQIAETDLIVSRGLQNAPSGALDDPRHAALGWRHYGDTDQSEDVDWRAIHVEHAIPVSGQELTPETYVLEAGFERLNGVDFKKGCFVGQEIVARMKHKTTLRKGLARVQIDGSAREGDEITKDGKAVGTLHSISGDQGLAFLRFDRATGAMDAGEATLTRIED